MPDPDDLADLATNFAIRFLDLENDPDAARAIATRAIRELVVDLRAGRVTGDLVQCVYEAIVRVASPDAASAN